MAGLKAFLDARRYADFGGLAARPDLHVGECSNGLALFVDARNLTNKRYISGISTVANTRTPPIRKAYQKSKNTTIE